MKVAAEDKARQGVDLAVLDFADAFKQLPVHLSEERFLSGRMSRGGMEGWFHLPHSLLRSNRGSFALVSSTRIAHALTASLTRGLENSSCRAVDDPLLGFSDEICSRLSCCFGVLGFKLSWLKGATPSSDRKESRSPMINLVVAEMQLALGKSTHSVAAAHFWGEHSVRCSLQAT